VRKTSAACLRNACTFRAMSNETIEKAIKDDDALALLKATTPEELARLKAAEEVLQLYRERTRSTTRWTLVSSTLVGIVAVVGMLVNSYQSFTNRQTQRQQAEIDQDRWNKEFIRAQRADKYRAFFETSVLATDPTNSDKRLVGYALLQEFVNDDDYNSKATLMLEESLGQELRSKRSEGLDEAHRSAVVAIVSALAQSSDCHALERASKSIDKITLHHARAQDAKEVLEIFRIYVRRLVGRAALTCKSMKDFADVRSPLIDAIQRMPELGGAMIKLPTPVANERVARLLVEVCDEESSINGLSECKAIFDHYALLCADATATPDDVVACDVIKTAGVALAAQNVVPAVPKQP
jgi:hypothetical protein